VRRRAAALLPSILLALELTPGAAALAAGAAQTPGVLVGYSFDDDNVATGPDTFAVYRAAKGHVGLSTALRLSGYRSVEIRDTAGDGDFPELQGYFPIHRSGTLYAHFALLTTDVRETFNVALAGPQWFALKKDGIGFWLQGRNGVLYHTSDSMPKRLLPLRPFVWYLVDVVYRVAEGTYDLTIREEGRAAPLVSLAAQPNAANQPGSAVDKFSFVGDVEEDASNVVYYVDDVVLATDGPVDTRAFTAPGRRRLFIDAWLDQVRSLSRGRGCLSASGPEDFGMSEDEMRSVGRAIAGDLVAAALRSAGAATGALPPDVERRLQPVALWSQGCSLLQAGRAEEALGRFDEAAHLEPRGRLFVLSAVLALARLGRFDEADARLAAIAPDRRDDLRYEVTAALVGLLRDDLDKAESWLRAPAEKISDGVTDDSRRRVEQIEIADQYFFVLLWKGSYREAERFATRMADRLRALGTPDSRWIERTGDAAFFLGDLPAARGRYEQALPGCSCDLLLYAKLSDVAWRSGDLDRERSYREKIYGSLEDDSQ
jgi:hypothetical protein